MPPDEQQLGQAQEERVRSYLVGLGYTQPYGITDGEIRRNLGIRGKCADFVGYHPQLTRWLVAESKGGNIDAAYKQLRNTLVGLLVKRPEAEGKIGLELHIDANNFAKLRVSPSASNRINWTEWLLLERR